MSRKNRPTLQPMISSLLKAFSQTFDPVFRATALKGLISSMLLFGVIFGIVWSLLATTNFVNIFWLENILDALGWFATALITWIVFPAVTIAIVSLFLSEIAAKVESKHYPDLPEPRHQSVNESLRTGLKYMVLVLTLNLAILPVYLALLFLPPVNIFVFIALNGYLFGREYFELVAYRRLSPQEAEGVWKSEKKNFIYAGGIITFLFSIPFINWFMPIVATAFMLHVFENRKGKKV